MSLIVAAFAALTLQQAPDERASGDCLDDRHTDRCSEADRVRVLQLYGAPTIEADAASGAEVYRVLYVDGYGRDLGAVAFERRPGAPPNVRGYFPGGLSITAPVSPETWTRIQAAARFADQAVAPPTPAPVTDPDKEEIVICGHSWVYTVEMANAPNDQRTRTPVRRRTEDACFDGITSQFADLLDDLALASLPHCRLLEQPTYRGEVNLLRDCARLSGDTHAAASLLVELDGRADRRRAVNRFWNTYLGLNSHTRLDWSGQVVESPLNNGPVVRFLDARDAEFGDLAMRINRVVGVDSETVDVQGSVYYPANFEDERSTQIAVSTQRWKWNASAFDWVLETWTVGPFRPEDVD